MDYLNRFLREVECYDQKWFDAIGGIGARQELQALTELHKAVEYYRSCALGVPPSFVPKLIRLPTTVRADFVNLRAPAGVYSATANRWGAVSVEIDGQRLGIKLAQFEVVEWADNPHPTLP